MKMNEPKKILYDHDWGADCDDGGAVAMVVKAHKAGRVKVLGITDCVGNPWGSYATKAVCEYFGVDDIPVGWHSKSKKMTDACYWSVTKEPAEKWYEGKELPELEDNIRLWRRILAENNKKDITIATTGQLITVFDVMNSGPDDISPKTGRELLIENIKEFAVGGGHFLDWQREMGLREYNFWEDSESSLSIINDYFMPLTFVGNNVGGPIISGNRLGDAPDDYPVKLSYWLLTESPAYTRYSWDLAVVFWAMYGSGGIYDLERNCTITIDADGHTAYASDGGPHSYVKQAASSELITQMFDEFLMP